ncbi:uncharacterized protein LOC133482130 isoform X2 [Phyllopteryx taeniolatus]|uniref:uncharacterized protein LOC133482130 isoform X2 n=1 Tax=Phyllopteryx taeniolatus TaxID=161469 RepID=UPI002AD1D429|nr:uncharacterized protein LOC133482130 isoform X2 [Phyllopteryx taeniolatus]
MSVNMMSTNGTSPLWFLDVCDGRFYFQVDVDGLDGAVREDSFRKSQCISYLIQNKDNKYLLLGDNSQFEVQHLTIQKKSLPASQFNVQFYNESGLKVRKGLAVMLYANKNGSKMVVCCSDKREIYPQAMDLPARGGVHPEPVASQSQGTYKQTPIHTYGQFRAFNQPTTHVLWNVGGNSSARRKLTQARGVHANSTHAVPGFEPRSPEL